jgi:glycosyltransferase involved in cell wall biosynthesis
MRILIVANHNTGKFTSFITEQVESIRQLGVEVDYYGVHGKGIGGYLANLSSLKAKIREYHPDLIHAHYGLSGLLANLQRQVPVVTTYHGSDIHTGGRTLFFSKIAARLSAYNIFVSKRLLDQSGYNGQKKCIIPCGIDTNTFHPIDRAIARKAIGWDSNGTYIFFAGAFDNKVKNSPLAKAAVEKIEGAKLMEMRGYTRDEVNLGMNAADCLLLTSYREGAPLVIKEAMACGTPIVAVNVGDIDEILSGMEGCHVTSHDVNEVTSCIRQALSFQGKTKGRQRIIENGFSQEQIAKKIIDIYNLVLNKRK